MMIQNKYRCSVLLLLLALGVVLVAPGAQAKPATAKKKGKAPPPQMEQEALQMLKSDSQMRAAFISKVAAPIANKMFECGMIP